VVVLVMQEYTPLGGKHARGTALDGAGGASVGAELAYRVLELGADWQVGSQLTAPGRLLIF
jgi:hypothetical protein